MSSNSRTKLRYIFFVFLPVIIAALSWNVLGAILVLLLIFIAPSFIPARYRTPLIETVIGFLTGLALHTYLLAAFPLVAYVAIWSWFATFAYWSFCYLLTP